MGLLDKVKISNFTNFFGLSDDEYEEYEGDVESSAPAFSQPRQANKGQAAVGQRKTAPIRVQQQPATSVPNQNRMQTTPVRQQTANRQQRVRVQQPAPRMEQAAYRQQAQPSMQQNEMKTPQNQFSSRPVAPRSYEQQGVNRIPQAVASSRPDQKVVELRSAQKGGSSSRTGSATTTRATKDKTLSIAIKEPRVYSEAMDIGKILMDDDAVLVNFHLMEEHSAARCVDFFTGIVYAIDGDVQRVGSQIFLCTPASIQIDGNQARSLLHEHNFDL